MPGSLARPLGSKGIQNGSTCWKSIHHGVMVTSWLFRILLAASPLFHFFVQGILQVVILTNVRSCLLLDFRSKCDTSCLSLNGVFKWRNLTHLNESGSK